MHKFRIIGIGPGTEDYLLPIARKEIENADCLVGAKRLLLLFTHLKKEKIYLEGHFKDAILYIKKNRAKKKIAVLVSGDPGLYSFLEQVKKSLKKQSYEVIPGISCLQVAFAKIGESWNDAKIISLHGRSLGNLACQVKASAKVFLLTDPCFPPDKIASYLLSRGTGNRRAVVFENLTYPHEKIVYTDLKKLNKMNHALAKNKSTDKASKGGVKDFGLCVMLIKK